MKAKRICVLAGIVWLLLWINSGLVLGAGRYCKQETHEWIDIPEDGCTDRWTIYRGLYNSVNEADAARRAAGYYTPVGCSGGSQCVGVVCGEDGNHYKNCGYGNFPYLGYWYAKKGCYDDRECDHDLDDDGIDDEIDPYPDDVTPFKWGKWIEIRDSEGVLKAIGIKTDRGDSFWFGDAQFANDCVEGVITDCHKVLNVSYGDEYPYSGSDLNNYVQTETRERAEGLVGGSSEVVDGERQVSGVAGIESGVASAPGDSDSDLLRKIVDNTASSNVNLGKLGERLKAIEQEVRDSRVASVSGSGEGGASASSIGSAVSAAEGARSNSEGEALEGTLGNDLSGITGSGGGSIEENTGFTSEEAGERNLIGDAFDSFISGSGIQAIVAGSGVATSSPVCNYVVSLPWGDVEFDFCYWSDSLSLLGNLMLALAGLAGVFIVFRGA